MRKRTKRATAVGDARSGAKGHLRREPRIARVPAWAVLGAMMLCGAGLSITSMTRKAVTYDETSHLTAGYTYWRMGDFRFTPEHPPLAELVAAAPLNWLTIQMPPTEGRAWEIGEQWMFGRDLLNRPNDVDRMLFCARLPIVALWCLGGVLVWLWSGRLFGTAGGLLSACLYFFSPTMMAHGRLVTTDIAAAVFFTASLLTFVRVMARVSWSRLITAAVCFAALFLSKFSAALIVPVVAVVAVACVLGPEPTKLGLFGRREVSTRAAKAALAGAVLMSIAVFCVLAIWSVFGFRYRAAIDAPGQDYDHMLSPPHVIDARGQLSPEQRSRLTSLYGREDLTAIQQLLQHRPALATVVGWAESRRLLPEAYLYGFAFTLWSAQSRAAFLLGQVRTEGWWYYFPVTFGIKTPLPTLSILVLAALAAWRLRTGRGVGVSIRPTGWSGPAKRLSLIAIWVFLVVYGLASVTSHLNIGHRHILPMYPVMFVMAGAAGRWVAHRWRVLRVLVPALAACLVAANVSAWPDYLPYFNWLIGEPRNGWKYLSDSNVDWGQDLKHVARYFADRPYEDVKLAYFGSGRPEYYGLKASYFEFPFKFYFAERERPGPLAEFTGGTFVVSATALQAVYQPHELREWNEQLESEFTALQRHLIEMKEKGGGSEQDWRVVAGRARRLAYMKLLARLRTHRPDEMIGCSVLIFRLSRDELAKLMTTWP